MQEIKLQIDGMHCASCPLLVDDFLEEIEGVVESRTDLRTGICVVKTNSAVDIEELIRAVSKAGYSAKLSGMA